MERIRINSKENIIGSGDYSLDIFDDVSIKTEVNSNCNILISNLSNYSSINLTINKDSNVTLSILCQTDTVDAKIKVLVKNNGFLEGIFADFSKNSVNINCQIDLEEEEAGAYFRLASLASKDDMKNIDISINHLSPKTYGKVDNYGVCKDKAKLVFLGTSHILNKSVKSKTQQNAKIMVFDEASDAVAKPILKIDENDIEASHAAAVGKINDEHLFYLTSRGIKESEAKQLITFGYLKPILLGFKEESIKENISSLIEGRM